MSRQPFSGPSWTTLKYTRILAGHSLDNKKTLTDIFFTTKTDGNYYKKIKTNVQRCIKSTNSKMVPASILFSICKSRF